MIGRAALGNPYLFRQINELIETGDYSKPDNKFLKKNIFSEYLNIAAKHHSKFSVIKAHAIYFTKGMANAAKMRLKLSQCKNIEEISSIMEFA